MTPGNLPAALGSHRWAVLRRGMTKAWHRAARLTRGRTRLRKSPGACGAPGAFGGRRLEQSYGAARPLCSGGTWVKPQHAISSWRHPWEAQRMRARVLLTSSMLWAVLVQQDTPGPPCQPCTSSRARGCSMELCKPWGWLLHGASGTGWLESLARAVGTREAAWHSLTWCCWKGAWGPVP